jgi:site-specific DNA recombinase
MKCSAIYARVSTDKQEQQKTIDSQLAELREACRRDGSEAVEEYTDNGVSGATLERPALDRLRDDASRGLFQRVYILSPDRLARKYVYQALVLEELKKRGVEAVFLNKSFEDNPEDQLLLGIEGLLAEYERAKIMERTRRGRMHRARQGEIVTSTPPFGYHLVRDVKERHAYYTVNGDEAEVVRLIFSLYLKLRSTTQVSKDLYKRGIRSKLGSKVWHPCVLNHVLRSECYVGRAYYNKTQGTGKYRDRAEWILIPVPSIVDAKTFQLAQEILSQHGGGRKIREYPLAHLVRCAHCGSTYVGNLSNHRTRPYYRCTNRRRRFPLPPNCYAKLIRAERLEAGVINALRDALLKPEILLTHLREQAAQIRLKAKEATGEIEKSNFKLARLEEKQQKLLDLYLDGRVSKDEYIDKKEAIERDMADTEGVGRRLRREVPQVDEQALRDSIGHFSALAKEKLDSESPVVVGQFLRLLVEEVIYDWQKQQALVKAHFPLCQDSGGSLAPLAGDKTPEKRDNVLRFELQVAV